jgi:hypothetical protein
MKRIVLAAFSIGCAFAIPSMSAEARVRISIDLSTQRMSVQSSSGSYVWPVSTARAGFSTPRGSYAPTSLQRMHYSRKYHMSPMPYSIFFRGGYAIHGTYSVGALGRPASHGCVRLAPGNAAALFQMVKNEGASISITGTAPGGHLYASARHRTRVAAHGYRAHRAQFAGRYRNAPMAYAPVRYYRPWGGVGAWQRDPFSGR